MLLKFDYNDGYIATFEIGWTKTIFTKHHSYSYLSQSFLKTKSTFLKVIPNSTLVSLQVVKIIILQAGT